jgi:hypothetical protein
MNNIELFKEVIKFMCFGAVMYVLIVLVLSL